MKLSPFLLPLISALYFSPNTVLANSPNNHFNENNQSCISDQYSDLPFSNSYLEKIISKVKTSDTEKSSCGLVYVYKLPDSGDKHKVHFSYAPNNLCPEKDSYFSLFYLQNDKLVFMMDGASFKEDTGIDGASDGVLDLIVNPEISLTSLVKNYYFKKNNITNLHHWFVESYANQNNVLLSEINNLSSKNNCEKILFYQSILDRLAK